jgi:hypothetical protein
MAYLMHIGFDNSSRLCRRVYYLQYKGIKYKLIQNNMRKWCDVLLTIIPGRDNEEEKNKAYITASEFLSALSWENNSQVKVHHIGGRGIPENFQLRKAKCSIRSFPRIPFMGYIVGYDICRIPEIETEDQRNALILFREASSSNNDYLSFLFFWEILKIGRNNPVGWVNKTYRKNRHRIRVTNDQFGRLKLGGKRLGEYFLNDCRNAIAHISGLRAGKVKLKLDTPAEITRITISTWVIKEFARFYIRDKLKLDKSMYLMRKRGKGFPTYITEEDAKRFPGTIAYKRLSHKEIRKKRRY